MGHGDPGFLFTLNHLQWAFVTPALGTFLGRAPPTVGSSRRWRYTIKLLKSTARISDQGHCSPRLMFPALRLHSHPVPSTGPVQLKDLFPREATQRPADSWQSLALDLWSGSVRDGIETLGVSREILCEWSKEQSISKPHTHPSRQTTAPCVNESVSPTLTLSQPRIQWPGVEVSSSIPRDGLIQRGRRVLEPVGK